MWTEKIGFLDDSQIDICPELDNSYEQCGEVRLSVVRGDPNLGQGKNEHGRCECSITAPNFPVLCFLHIFKPSLCSKFFRPFPQT
jgi:hypothetical protein